MPMPVAGFPDAAMIACLFFIFLVPLAAAGISLINAGLGRSRNAGHMMMAVICTLSIAAIVYFICGFAWQGFIGRPGHILALSGKSWNWIAAEPFFFRGLALDGSPSSLAALLQIFCVGLAALIPLGSGADRWRLRASCASAALLAGWTYPLFAHWVWGGGWLAQLGANYGLGHGFIEEPQMPQVDAKIVMRGQVVGVIRECLPRRCHNTLVITREILLHYEPFF